MSFTYDKTKLRATADIFCSLHNSKVTQMIGFGTQGVVFRTRHNTAVKVHALVQGYQRERDVYLRLREREIQIVRGMAIPRMVAWDDALRAFEMSIVHVPCVLDFGGAYVDHPPQHMCRDADWFEQKAHEFGGSWVEAQAVIRELEHRGDIWLADVNTGNIKFDSP